MKKCLIYNISLDIVNIDELVIYISELGKIEFLLNDIFKCYTGSCEIYADIGFYNFKEPDCLVKSIKPVMHIMVYGTKIDYIKKKINKCLRCDFYPNSYEEYHLEDNPFDSGNDELLYNACYRSKRFKVDNEIVALVA